MGKAAAAAASKRIPGCCLFVQEKCNTAGKTTHQGRGYTHTHGAMPVPVYSMAALLFGTAAPFLPPDFVFLMKFRRLCRSKKCIPKIDSL